LLLFNNFLPPVIIFLVIFSFHNFFSLLSCDLIEIGIAKIGFPDCLRKVSKLQKPVDFGNSLYLLPKTTKLPIGAFPYPA